MLETIHPFTPLLKLNADQKFVWREEQEKALHNVKNYLKKFSCLNASSRQEAVQVIPIS
jgi:hypothetical protein